MKKSIVTVPVINSMALFIYSNGYTDKDDYLTVYNSWRDFCEFQVTKVQDAILLLQYVQSFLHTPKDVLEEALKEDHLL